MDEQAFHESIRRDYAEQEGMKLPSPENREKIENLKLIDNKIVTRNLAYEEEKILAGNINQRLRNLFALGVLVNIAVFLYLIEKFNLVMSRPHDVFVLFAGFIGCSLLFYLYGVFLNKKKTENTVIVFDSLVSPLYSFTQNCLGLNLRISEKILFVRKANVADIEFLRTLKYGAKEVNSHRITMIEKSHIILSVERL